MFEVETFGKTQTVRFDSSADAESVFYHLAARGKSAWLWMGETMLLCSVDGEVIDRNAKRVHGATCPVYF